MVLVQGLLLRDAVTAQAPANSEVAASELLAEALEQVTFRSIGPTRQGGRVVSFAVEVPEDSSAIKTFYVAGGPGGLYKTINAGQSFRSVFDHGGVASIGDVALDPRAPQTVWVGTGEANLRNSTYYGDGVYRSLDGGQSWDHRGLAETRHIGRVVVHPENSNVIFVAAQGAMYRDTPVTEQPNAERGLFRSRDGGTAWTNVLSPVVDGPGEPRAIGVTEVVLDPADPDVIWAVAYDRRRFPWSFRIAGPGSGIWKSEDGGDTWRKLSSDLPEGHLGKIGLAVFSGGESNARTLYATIDNQNSPGMSFDDRWAELESGLPASRPTVGHEIYRSDDGGQRWRKVSADGESIGNRSNYYGQIVVAPDDPERLFVLSSGCDESRDGGRTFARCFRFGGDNHVLYINPKDSDHFLLGYDYGMAISQDGGAHWYHPDELSLAQVYAVSVDDARPYNVYLGVQDFGSWRGPSTAKGRFPLRFEDWEHMNGGDGMENQVDPANRRFLYSGAQFGDLVRIDQQTGERQTVMPETVPGQPEERLRYNWKAPLVFSKHDADTFYYGAHRLLVSQKGDWRVLSPDLSHAEPAKLRGVGAVQYATITAIEESPWRRGELWAGTDDGNLWLGRAPLEESSGPYEWQKLNDRLPSQARRPSAGATEDAPLALHWVRRIQASRHREGLVFAALSGFHYDDHRALLFRSLDGGETWHSAAQGLPQATVNVVRESPRAPGVWFAGHDVGVSVTFDDGASWFDLGATLPTIPVHDLVVHQRQAELVLGTHGRGIYIADISWLEQWSPDRAFEHHLFVPEDQVQWRMVSQPARSAQNFEGENRPAGVVIWYWLAPGEEASQVTLRVFRGDTELQVLEAPATPGLHSVEWGMTRVDSRSSSELLAWDELMEELAADEEFFDYYDTVEQFAREGEEVDRRGRSLKTRVHRGPNATERERKYLRVGPGTYRVELSVAGRRVGSARVELLEDRWFQEG